MKVEKIVVNDTNIFLDLISVDLLDGFFSLPFEFHTTDFVIGEIIKPKQQVKLSPFTESKKLNVVSFDFDELSKIIKNYSALPK